MQIFIFLFIVIMLFINQAISLLTVGVVILFWIVEFVLLLASQESNHQNQG
jgi:hypothetical protein